MKKIIFITVFASVCLIASCQLNNKTAKQDAFVNLKWDNDFCDNVVGVYRYWYPSPVSARHVDNKMMALDRPILEKDTNKIYFRNQFNHGSDKPELDFGEFEYKIYKRSNNQVVIELEDRFLEILKEKIPEEYHYFGKYFIFEPTLRNLEEKGSKFEDWNCKIAIASCKTIEQVEKTLSRYKWHLGYREEGDCEREWFATILKE